MYQKLAIVWINFTERFSVRHYGKRYIWILHAQISLPQPLSLVMIEKDKLSRTWRNQGFMNLKKSTTIFVRKQCEIKSYSLFFLSRVVAAPIQVQFSSNSPPIVDWKSIVFALCLHLLSLCLDSALFIIKQNKWRGSLFTYLL